ncbi:MAG: ImmA/IrrE family metallo-endopeptidase [Myxococcaceae bacterium]
MTVASNPMAQLYQKLASFGLPPAYVRSTILPSWWDDAAAETPAGFSEALMLVHRHAGIDVGSLRASDPKPHAATGPVKFKHDSDVLDEEFDVPRVLATQAGWVAAMGASDSKELPKTASALRARLLDRCQWIDLEVLVDYCWSVGVPVLHVSKFPAKTKKMQGLTANVSGRPVIVISTERKSAPWLLFVVAHELGHACLGHVATGQVLVDGDIDRDSVDDEEIAANRFTVELLSGAPDTTFKASSRWPNAHQLADIAQRIAREMQTDPGFVVLNYAYSMGGNFFGVANAALKLLPPTEDGPALLRRKMAEKLDWSRLPEESSEFLTRITQAGMPNASTA